MRQFMFQVADLLARGFHGMSTATAVTLFSKGKTPPRQRILLRGAGVRIFSKA